MPRRVGRSLRPLTYRTRIIEGAMQAFEQKGLDATSVEDILQAAGVSRRTFYRFFDNKQAVLRSLYDMATQLLVEQIERALETGSEPLEQISASVDAWLEFTQDAGKLLHVMGAEARNPESRLHPRRRLVVERLVRLLGDQVERLAGLRIEPLVLHGLLLALEGIAFEVSAEGPASRERARAAMLRIVAASLARPGDPVPELPLES